MTDYSLLERRLDSGKLLPNCPYLRGYYCLVGGKGTECPSDVVSGSVYMCGSSVFKSRYHRLLNERVKV